MKRYIVVVVPLVLGLFVLQSIAEAASISTRVRILEGKVAKHDKVIKQSLKSIQSKERQTEQTLAKIQALEKKVDRLLKKNTQKKRFEPADKRYAFP